MRLKNKNRKKNRQKMKLLKNEDGSVGYIVWVAISLFMIATYWVAGGVVIQYAGDVLTTQITDDSYHVSETRVQAFNIVTLAFVGIPAIVLITVAILATVAYTRRRSGTIG